MTEDIGKILVDYGVAGAVVLSMYLSFRYIKHRDEIDASTDAMRRANLSQMASDCHTSHEKNTKAFAEVAEHTSTVIERVGERLGENTSALQGVKDVLARRIDR